MREIVQAPVSREALREWVEDRYGVYMDVRSEDDKVLRVHNDTLFPEISVLFAGDAEKFNDTVEICGMYDKKAQEFRFVSDQLVSIVNGISEAERWQGVHPSEDVYARISGYAKEAVETKGYRFQNKMDSQFAEIRQDAQSALSVMAEYAAYPGPGAPCARSFSPTLPAGSPTVPRPVLKERLCQSERPAEPRISHRTRGQGYRSQSK